MLFRLNSDRTLYFTYSVHIFVASFFLLVWTLCVFCYIESKSHPKEHGVH